MIAYHPSNGIKGNRIGMTESDLCNIDIEKSSTGIEELDSQMNGGIPMGSTVLVVGSSGSGKTTLCTQFLVNGTKNDERGVFFTITEPLFKLTKNLEGFEFYNKQLVETGMVNIIDLRIISERLGLDTEKYSVEDASALLDILNDIAKELDVKRLVIDSITALCYRLKSDEMIRDFIFKLGTSLAAMGCTTLLTSEIEPVRSGELRYSKYGIEEFIADGIIFLGDTERRGDLIRTLQLIKMRGTEHSRTKFAMNISSKRGIELLPLLKS